MTLEKKHKVLTDTVAHHFNTVGENDILRFERGKWFAEGRELSEAEIKQFREEAELILKLPLWKLLEREIQYQANQTMFFKSQTETDILAGKLLLYYLDILKTRLHKLSTG